MREQPAVRRGYEIVGHLYSSPGFHSRETPCVVWRAREDGYDYAIKSVTSGRLFRRELRMNSHLLDVHQVPGIHEAFEENGFCYIVQQFVGDADMARRLYAHGNMSLARCIGQLREVAGQASQCHERGIVHLDIKPANIRIGTGVHLIDFDVAARTWRPVSTFRYKTIHQFPPEKRSSVFLATPDIDLYMVANTLHEVVGETLSPTRDFTDLYDAGSDPELVRLGKPLRRFFADALSREQKRRPQSALELQRRLADLESDPLTLALDDLLAERASPRLARAAGLGH